MYVFMFCNLFWQTNLVIHGSLIFPLVVFVNNLETQPMFRSSFYIVVSHAIDDRYSLKAAVPQHAGEASL